jgi:glutamate dehydrogenase (NAD(P)+)
MAWIFDEYSKYKGFSPAVVTGKPLHLHGSLGREQAGGRGVLFAAREFLRDALCARVQGSAFVIQGFGKLGSSAARHIHDAGGKVVAVADARGAVHNERGLDIPLLQAHAARGGMLSDFEGGGALMADPVSFLSMPCDVLIPAAIGGVLTAGTAAKVQCRAVIEAANAACTPEGDAVVSASVKFVSLCFVGCQRRRVAILLARARRAALCLLSSKQKTRPHPPKQQRRRAAPP